MLFRSVFQCLPYLRTSETEFDDHVAERQFGQNVAACDSGSWSIDFLRTDTSTIRKSDVRIDSVTHRVRNQVTNCGFSRKSGAVLAVCIGNRRVSRSDGVEGYANFGWVRVMTLPHLLSADIPRIADLWAVLCTVAPVVLLYFCGQNFRPRRPMVFALVAPVLLATNGALAFWTFSGMETALFTLLLNAGVCRYIRDLRETTHSQWTGAFFGLAALTRPEDRKSGV